MNPPNPPPHVSPTPRPRAVRPKVLARLAARQKLIANLIEQRGGVVPTVRTVQALMREGGCRVSLGTVHTDMKSLRPVRC